MNPDPLLEALATYTKATVQLIAVMGAMVAVGIAVVAEFGG